MDTNGFQKGTGNDFCMYFLLHCLLHNVPVQGIGPAWGYCGSLLYMKELNQSVCMN